MNSPKQFLLESLSEFYELNPTYLDIVRQLAAREFLMHEGNKISIRLINWFVTNYAKHDGTSYYIPDKHDPTKQDLFMVWNRFGSAKRGYTKDLFDPYSRGERIAMPYIKNQVILSDGDLLEGQFLTTIAQLNFHKWAITNGVFDYITNNLHKIALDLKLRCTAKNKTNQINRDKTKTRKKREELSVSACKSCKKYIQQDINITHIHNNTIHATEAILA